MVRASVDRQVWIVIDVATRADICREEKHSLTNKRGNIHTHIHTHADRYLYAPPTAAKVADAFELNDEQGDPVH